MAKTIVTKEYKDEGEYYDAFQCEQELKEKALLYDEVYRCARYLWKHSDKESITIEELQDFFYRLSDK